MLKVGYALYGAELKLMADGKWRGAVAGRDGALVAMTSKSMMMRMRLAIEILHMHDVLTCFLTRLLARIL